MLQWFQTMAAPALRGCAARAGLAGACLAMLAGTAQAGPWKCPSPAPGIRDIQAQGYYTDATHSVVDEAARRANKALTAPFDDFAGQVAQLSDRYLADHDTAAGECAVRWLERWARDGAMLGEMVHVNNDQSDYMRQWMLAGIAIASLKVQGLASPAQSQQINQWLSRLAVENLAYWSNPRKTRNNHYYWTGVGVMAAAVASHDDALLEAARRIYLTGTGDIRDDGSLPLEMQRGKRALQYHNYALAPLVLMAELARLNGLDWYAGDGRRLDLLAQRVADGYHDSTWFARQAGVPQESARPNREAGWVEFYRLRAPHPGRFDALHRAGPYVNPRMGGDLTLMARTGIRTQEQGGL